MSKVQVPIMFMDKFLSEPQFFIYKKMVTIPAHSNQVIYRSNEYIIK